MRATLVFFASWSSTTVDGKEEEKAEREETETGKRRTGRFSEEFVLDWFLLCWTVLHSV